MSVKDELLEIATQDPDAEEALTEQLKYEDLGDKLVKWYKGAVMGAEEIGRATNTAYANAPQVLKDDYSLDWNELPENTNEDFTYTDKGKATTYTPSELEVKYYLDRAVTTFQEETLRPVATVAATFGGEVGLALLAPFMINDIGKAIDDEDYVGAAKTTAMLASPALARAGGFASKANAVVGVGLMGDMALGTATKLGDENYQEYANADPYGAMGNMGMELAPMLHPAIQGIKGARTSYLHVKDKLTKAQAEAKVEAELNPKPKEKTQSEPIKEKKVEFVPKKEVTVSDKIDMGSNKKVQENVKSIEDRYREKQMWDDYEKQIITNGVDEPYRTRDADNNVVEVAPAPVENGGFWSRLWRGDRTRAVRVQEIHEAANEITPITYGDTGDPNTLGFYNPQGQGVRSGRHQWFETISHEVTHYVDAELLRLGGFDDELVSNAKRRWHNGEYGDPRNPANDPAYRREGIADFGTVWMLNHETARQIYPEYSAAFERALEANPQLQRRIETLSELIRRWYTQTDEQRGIGSSVYSGDGKATIERNGIRGVMQEKLQGVAQTLDRVETEVSDNLSPFRNSLHEVEDKLGIHFNLEENPADLIHHAMKEIPARVALFLGENKSISSRDAIQVLSEVYNVELREVTMRDVYDRMDNLRGQQHIQDYCRQHGMSNVHVAVSEYLKALHSLEILFDRGEDYVTTGSVERHHNIVQNAPQEFVEIANMVSDYNYNMLNLAARFGLTDFATVARFRSRYPYYVPFQRSFAPEGVATNNPKGSRGGEFVNIDNIFRGLSEHGSDRDILDPLTEMQMQTGRLIAKGQKNLVAQQTAHLCNMAGGNNLVVDRTGENVAVGKEHGTFEVWENGQRHVYEATNPVVYQVLAMPPDVAALGNTMLGGYLRWSASALRVGSTQTLPFTIWNGIRDSLTASITTKTVPLREFYKANPIYFLFNGLFKQVLGGENALTNLMDEHNVAPNYRAYCRELRSKYEVSGSKYATRYRTSEQLGHQRITETEIHGHSNPYETARTFKSYAKRSWDFIWDIMTAGKAGEYVENAPRFTEFERTLRQGGSLMEAADNAFNITVDFDRHGNMSSLTQYTAFYNAAVQGNVKLFRDVMSRPETVIPFALINLTVPSIVLWNINKDKDWYKSITIDEKMKNWHIETPNGTIMRIPKPELLGYIAASMPERMLDYHYMQDKEGNIGKAVSFLQDSMIMNLTPTGAIPIYEWLTNYKFYTGRQIVDQKHLAMEEKDQYTVYTSEISKKIGSTAYDMGLHSKLTSPALIDNAIRDIGGSTASFWLGLYDDMSGEHKAPARKNTEQTRFTYTPDTMKSREMQDFFDLYEREKKKYNSTKRKSKTLTQIEGAYNEIKKLRVNFNAKYIDPKGKGYNLSDVDKRQAQDTERDKPANAIARKALARVGRKYFKNPENN